MTGNLATINRDGKLINIDEDNLRQGDTVVLQVGEIVPADLRLVEANGLEIDEFEITGELLPVAKSLGEDDVVIYMGSRVTRGTGRGVVLATGEQTEYGRIVKQASEQKEKYRPHILEKKYLTALLLFLPAFIIHVIHSNNLINIVAFYLMLSVLLVILQNDLFFANFLASSELKKFRDLGFQIDDNGILERMSNVDLICFDKTGVLTTREISVKNIYLADGMRSAESVSTIETGAFHLIKMVCALCHDVLLSEKLVLANPIDKALISFALTNGVDANELIRYRRIYDQPFDPESRYMISGFELDGDEYYFAKGDPEVIQSMCDSYMTSAGIRKKVGFEFWHFNRSNLELINQSGDTVIALAYAAAASEKPPTKYTFLCLVQLENPLREEARRTVKGIRENGLRSVLLTGDRAETAVKVAEECEIAKNSKSFLTGRIIERMDPMEVARQASYCSVFARLLPSQKGFLIRLLQERGYCIAMVGDGANDAIALKAADIGISFIEQSSSIARGIAKVLINDLADLLRLLEGAKRIKTRAKHLRLFRTAVLAALFLGLYGWLFLSLYR